MTTLEQLDPIHRWVSHEFDILARDGFGWCVKGVGVQDLFGKREGALKILGRHFNNVTLFLRSLPDRCLYGKSGQFWFVEIKAIEDRPNIAVEAYQLCLLQSLHSLVGLNVVYLFGRPNGGEFEGWICETDKLPIEAWFETRIFREEWPNSLRGNLALLKRTYFPDVNIQYTNSEKGSGDPYVVFPFLRLTQYSQEVQAWFRQQGKQTFDMKERLAWEGRISPWGKIRVPTTEREVA